jgi:hypothetical protein
MIRVVLNPNLRLFYVGKAKEKDCQLWYRYFPAEEQHRQGRPNKTGEVVCVYRTGHQKNGDFKNLAQPAQENVSSCLHAAVHLEYQAARSKLKSSDLKFDFDIRLANVIHNTVMEINKHHDQSELPRSRYLLIKDFPCKPPRVHKIKAIPLSESRGRHLHAPISTSTEPTATQPKTRQTLKGGTSQERAKLQLTSKSGLSHQTTAISPLNKIELAELTVTQPPLPPRRLTAPGTTKRHPNGRSALNHNATRRSSASDARSRDHTAAAPDTSSSLRTATSPVASPVKRQKRSRREDEGALLRELFADSPTASSSDEQEPAGVKLKESLSILSTKDLLEYSRMNDRMGDLRNLGGLTEDGLLKVFEGGPPMTRGVEAYRRIAGVKGTQPTT